METPTETQRFVRKPFFVDAVQVTQENMGKIALWCGGEIRFARNRHDPETKTPYVKVNVKHAMNERQTRAFAGDWILLGSQGFKVYQPVAFENHFVESSNIVELTNVREY